MAEVDRFLKMAEALGASDVHIAVGSPPVLRLNGVLKRVKYHDLTAEDTERMIKEILSEEQIALFEEHKELDFAYQIPDGGRCRSNCCNQNRGLDATFRIIPDRISTIDELGFPNVIKQLLEYRQGLILITGQAGCGKSTTLAAMVDHLNERRAEHIITVEDPIEIIHHGKKAHIIQREVGRHTDSFARALRAALREDPDIIMVGEMRDLETISMAITAAETGHLVLATLHTSNAPRTVHRLLDVFPAEQQAQIRTLVADSLRGIICQQLVPTADGRGRVVAMEVLVCTPAVAHLINEDRTFQIPSVMQTGVKLGMRLMDDSLLELLQAGIIAPQTALEFAHDRSKFRHLEEARKDQVDWDAFQLLSSDREKRRMLVNKKVILRDRKAKQVRVLRRQSLPFHFYSEKHGKLPVEDIYAEVVRLFPKAEEKVEEARLPGA